MIAEYVAGAGDIIRAADRLRKATPPAHSRLFLGLCESLDVIVETISRGMAKELEQGIEGRKLLALAGMAAELAEAALSFYQATRDTFEHGEPSPCPGQQPDVWGGRYLDRLGDMRSRAEQVLKEARSLQSWAQQPPPAVDPAKLALREPGQYESLDDILARLRAGEDL